MFSSNKAIYMKELDYYEDLTKFARLGAWILNGLGGEIEELSDLIGDTPTLRVDRKLSETDNDLIKFAKENNIKYKVTNKGIKLML